MNRAHALLAGPVSVVHLGIESVAEGARSSGAEIVDVDFTPPCGGDPQRMALLADLRPIACRTRENDVIVDRMLFNTAFLVEQSREGEFDDAVARLDAKWGYRTDFRYTGPNPPWNFVEVIVSWEEL